MPVAGLMTVEEFLNLPDREDVIEELRNGEVVEVTRPKKRHARCVVRLDRLLAPVADPQGFLQQEFSFRPLAQHELRAADLAFVKRERWDAVADDDHLPGSPEFVVEVVSPSNTAEELQEKRDLCLDNGCVEFWTVYPKSKRIEVATALGTKSYGSGEVVPMVVFPGHQVRVDEVFS